MRPLTPTLSRRERAPISSKLLAWYRRNARALPWRENRDPWRVWVSEIMLQQTTVKTVIPYYERFLGRFPTVQALAEAPESEVLKFWAGLGYYRRARNLHAAAKVVVAERGGRLPEDPDGWRSLPGIGRYTAAAIASIACGARAAVLDGNVIRVLSRLFAVRGDPKRNEARLWTLAEELLPRRADPGDWNQAMMELGATICLPSSPLCEACPLKADCAARKLGLQEKLPQTAAEREPVQVRWTCLASRRDGRLLVERRTAGLLSGHWGLPELKDGGASKVADAVPLGAVRHSITHHRLEVRVLKGRWRGALPEGWSWVDEDEARSRLISSLWRKALALEKAESNALFAR